MKQIICDGCKTGEELGATGKQGEDIWEVKLTIAEDERESVPRVPIFADLCEKCRTEMLNKYFRQTVDLTEAQLPASLKVSNGD
jgi:hypothetical protein